MDYMSRGTGSLIIYLKSGEEPIEVEAHFEIEISENKYSIKTDDRMYLIPSTSVSYIEVIF